MAFPAKAVANEFLALAEERGQRLTPMKLQKLVYFAHGWYLAFTGKPLILERVQAWQYGPVIPDLYHEFKQYGDSVITERATEWGLRDRKICAEEPRIAAGQNPESDMALSVIKKVWEVYGKHSAVQLSNATHAEGTPWRKVYRDGQSSTVIPDDVIESWFSALKAKNEQSNAVA